MSKIEYAAKTVMEMIGYAKGVGAKALPENFASRYDELRRRYSGVKDAYEALLSSADPERQFSFTSMMEFASIPPKSVAGASPEAGILRKGKPLTAWKELVKVVSQAEREVALVDAYVGVGTVTALAEACDKATVRILTRDDPKRNKDFTSFVDTAKKLDAEHRGKLKIRISGEFHDRFLCLDDARVVIWGPSTKDAGGGRHGFFVEMVDPDLVKDTLDLFEQEWKSAKALQL